MAKTTRRVRTTSAPSSGPKPSTVELVQLPVWWTAGFLGVFALALSAFAWAGQQHLRPNQIAGIDQVLSSLEAELSVLRQEAQEGKVPGALLSKEEEHIEDQISEETKTLRELQQKS